MVKFWTFELWYEKDGKCGMFEVKPAKIDTAMRYLHERGCINITPRRRYYPNLISKVLYSDLILK